MPALPAAAPSSTSRAFSARPLTAQLRLALTFVRRALALRRSRRDLGRCDANRLADIGLTRHEADAEAARPVWDVPQHWRG